LRKNISYLGFIGVFIGLALSRFVVARYGVNARTILMIAILAISIVSEIVIIYYKKYLAALCTLSMLIPLIFMTIGMSIGNVFIVFIGLGLLFLLIPIMINFLNKYK
jgi:hypothetical protein